MHEKTHEPRTLTCENCRKYTTNSASNLTKHRNVTCVQNKQPLHFCGRCGKKFGTKKGLNNHHYNCIDKIKQSWENEAT
ncbi:unnamed protein product [Allacma fusca]|uniref:C2H2-type domain-containing protein n=1 Tax=Allacma fusca TaxID=39272 RepID=A0A8J2KXT2_9HEXA|nr:unnamed protein product [Allacma fusca]